MLGNIEIPLRTTLRDKNPDISVEQKLEHINQKQAIRGIPDPELGFVRFRLPYVDGLVVEFVEDDTVMSINHFNVGDKSLTGHGIGSRLLGRAIDYGMEEYPRLEKLRHSAANLAVVNTIVKVVGEEYVAVANCGERYGFGTDRPLEAMLDDRPYSPDHPYFVDSVEALLDREAWSADKA